MYSTKKEIIAHIDGVETIGEEHSCALKSVVAKSDGVTPWRLDAGKLANKDSKPNRSGGFLDPNAQIKDVDWVTYFKSKMKNNETVPLRIYLGEDGDVVNWMVLPVVDEIIRVNIVNIVTQGPNNALVAIETSDPTYPTLSVAQYYANDTEGDWASAFGIIKATGQIVTIKLTLDPIQLVIKQWAIVG